MEIFTKFNFDGTGCLKLYDLDDLLKNFNQIQSAALKRFFNYFIENTNL